MSYTVEGNTVRRDGVPVAYVQVDGALDVAEGMEQYRTQCVKELARAGRRNDDGTFVFVDTATPVDIMTAPDAPAADVAPESEIPAPPGDIMAAPDAPAITTVRELVAAVEAASGDTAPAFSPVWGDETPEVWAWLRRHVSSYNAVRMNRRIEIRHNHLED